MALHITPESASTSTTIFKSRETKRLSPEAPYPQGLPPSDVANQRHRHVVATSKSITVDR